MPAGKESRNHNRDNTGRKQKADIVFGRRRDEIYDQKQSDEYHKTRRQIKNEAFRMYLSTMVINGRLLRYNQRASCSRARRLHSSLTHAQALCQTRFFDSLPGHHRFLHHFIVLDSLTKESLTRSMSLRVLLADESDTIKKVFQLALQDLNAEVKSVHSGLDVLDVANTFQPTIIFADILLQKRNGYEICLEIKHSSTLKDVPVILMWSSFMELDQDQYKKSLANDQLEKPFDADHLRALVKKHTSSVDTNPMAQFLNFPKSIAADATPPTAPAAQEEPLSLDFGALTASTPPPAAPAIPLGESDSDEDTSEFNLANILGDAPATEASASPSPSSEPAKKSLFDDLAIDAEPASNQDAWAAKDLSAFQIKEDKSDELDKFETLNLGAPAVNAADNAQEDEEPTADLSESLSALHAESEPAPVKLEDVPP